MRIDRVCGQVSSLPRGAAVEVLVAALCSDTGGGGVDEAAAAAVDVGDLERMGGSVEAASCGVRGRGCGGACVWRGDGGTEWGDVGVVLGTGLRRCLDGWGLEEGDVVSVRVWYEVGDGERDGVQERDEEAALAGGVRGGLSARDVTALDRGGSGGQAGGIPGVSVLPAVRVGLGPGGWAADKGRRGVLAEVVALRNQVMDDSE